VAATNSLTAVALDGPVDLALVRDRLGWREVRRYAYGLSLQAPDESLVYLFAFGAFVLVNHDGLDEALGRSIEAVTGRRILRHTADTWSLVVDPEVRGARTRVRWDRVVLPGLSPDLVAVTAMLLGQSAALERFEQAADELVEDSLATATRLARTGRTPWGTGRLVRTVGQVNRDRLAMAAQLYILDRPEEAWDDPQVAALYGELLSSLELPQRQQTVLSKLETVESSTQMVIDLWGGRQSHRLEWAITLLIVFEIVLSLLHWR